jgi:hypothetical protein
MDGSRQGLEDRVHGCAVLNNAVIVLQLGGIEMI